MLMTARKLAVMPTNTLVTGRIRRVDPTVLAMVDFIGHY
jgi:hypothetical protein